MTDTAARLASRRSAGALPLDTWAAQVNTGSRRVRAALLRLASLPSFAGATLREPSRIGLVADVKLVLTRPNYQRANMVRPPETFWPIVTSARAVAGR